MLSPTSFFSGEVYNTITDAKNAWANGKNAARNIVYGFSKLIFNHHFCVVRNLITQQQKTKDKPSQSLYILLIQRLSTGNWMIAGHHWKEKRKTKWLTLDHTSLGVTYCV